jgi:uncharacterized membrane protein
MSDLVAIAYENLDTAQQVAANATEAQKSHIIELEDMVVVERRMDGKVKLHQPSLAGSGAVSGALWGGLIGLIFFVPFFGMAIGAGTGAAAGAFADYGIEDNFMKELGAALDPGKAAVIFLIRSMTPDRVLSEIKIPGTIIQTSLDGSTEQQLNDALAAAGQAAPA